MTLFFLVVGLEAKRELDLGELRERRRLAIPVVASLGGHGDRGRASTSRSTPAAPAAPGLGRRGLDRHGAGARRARARSRAGARSACACSCSRSWSSTTSSRCWSSRSATPRTSRSTALAVAIGLFGVLVALRWAGSWRGPAAVLVGIGIWFAMFESGVDAVIAGLAIGLVTSAYPPSARRPRAQHRARRARSASSRRPSSPTRRARASTSAISPNERLQYRLHPWTSRVIVPLFALANAGIHIDGDLLSAPSRSPVTLGDRRRLRRSASRSASSAPPGWRPGRAIGRRPADRHLAGARRRRRASAGDRLHRLAARRRAGLRRRSCSTRRSSACSRPPSLSPALALARVPRDAPAAGRDARPPARRDRRRCSSTSPRTSTPSATTSAAASTRP